MLKELQKRILEISYQKQLSHIGSCLSVLPILYEIYSEKKPEDKVILSAAHGSLALYVILEHFEGRNAEELFDKHGVHCCRDEANGIWFSGGSLGVGIGAAAGFAIAEPEKTISCVISDGEMFEGSVYEAFNVKQKYKVSNLKVYCNWNGWSAFEKVTLSEWWNSFDCKVFTTAHYLEQFEMNEQQAHYKVLNKQEYEKMLLRVSASADVEQ